MTNLIVGDNIGKLFAYCKSMRIDSLIMDFIICQEEHGGSHVYCYRGENEMIARIRVKKWFREREDASCDTVDGAEVGT